MTVKTWQDVCDEHPDHEGIVTYQMIQDRMQEEIDALRQQLAEVTRQRDGLAVYVKWTVSLKTGGLIQGKAEAALAQLKEEGK